MLKYPWTRRTPGTTDETGAAGGRASPDDPLGGSPKFGAYVTELADLRQARAPFAGRLADWQQTVEASVMDTADDIAYAIHDVEDFHRVGVLQQGSVATELIAWQRDARRWRTVSEAALTGPGRSVELLRRDLHRKDGWIAVRRGVRRRRRARPRRAGRRPAGRPVRRFGRGRAERRPLLGPLDPAADRRDRGARRPAGPLRPRAARPAPVARGAGAQARAPSVRARTARPRAAPARPGTAAGHAGRGAARLAARPRRGRPAAAAHLRPGRAGRGRGRPARPGPTSAPRRPSSTSPRWPAGRAIVDFVAALTDSQAVALLDALSGRSRQLWTDAFVL